MNKQRRKQIEKIVERLSVIRGELDDLRDEERMTLDSLPENMQSGSRAEKYEENIDGIEEAINDLDLVTDKLNEIIEI